MERIILFRRRNSKNLHQSYHCNINGKDHYLWNEKFIENIHDLSLLVISLVKNLDHFSVKNLTEADTSIEFNKKEEPILFIVEPLSTNEYEDFWNFIKKKFQNE
jgi:hypothetical protein